MVRVSTALPAVRSKQRAAEKYTVPPVCVKHPSCRENAGVEAVSSVSLGVDVNSAVFRVAENTPSPGALIAHNSFARSAGVETAPVA